MLSGPCKGKPKGYRFVKSASKCMKSCKNGKYRKQKSPWNCVTPKPSKLIGPKMKKCSKGTRRSKTTRKCEPTHFFLK